MTNDELHELAAAYALDALAADERHAFETHLSGCERCRTELAEIGEAAGALAYVAGGPAPPAALRDRILGAARANPPNVVALRPRRLRLYGGAALAAAACAGLAIGLWAALSSGPAPKRLALERGSSGSVLVAASGFSHAPAGEVYELWVIEKGQKPAPAGLFEGGPGTTRTTLALRARPGSVVAVTLERAPGAAAPTPPILAQTTA
jgi:anti-sigma-K factor RskA